MTPLNDPAHAAPPAESPEVRLNRLLGGGEATIATAESCTGGNVAGRITSVSGSSAYFLGGVVAYDNRVKTRLLAVPESILRAHGAVSAECARAMATGARELLEADYAVSTTGIAGPGGATSAKPVGLVYIGIASPAHMATVELRLTGDRHAIIDRSTTRALEALLEAIERDFPPSNTDSALRSPL
jgi:PncC family amidohydrolase